MHSFARAGGGWLAAAVIGLLAAVGALISDPAPSPAIGPATVVDGDTLRLGGERVRLIGIDAPELDQTCLTAGGETWSCGRSARTALLSLTTGRQVSCTPHGRDRYGRMLAHCGVAGDDLGRSLVAQGLAVADGDYFGEEAGARGARLGIWAGSFVAPAQWRRQRGETADGTGLIDQIRSWFR